MTKPLVIYDFAPAPFQNFTLHIFLQCQPIPTAHTTVAKRSNLDPAPTTENRGRILGRNWYKILKSFPPCYYSHLYLRILFTPLLEQKWFEIGL